MNTSVIYHMYTEKEKLTSTRLLRALELCESRGGRPGLSVPNSPYGLCGRKATLNLNQTAQGCEARHRQTMNMALLKTCTTIPSTPSAVLP